MNQSHEWAKHPSMSNAVTTRVDKYAQCSRCGVTRRWSAVNERYEYYGKNGEHIGTQATKCVQTKAQAKKPAETRR
jgi:hypothetical protein